MSKNPFAFQIPQVTVVLLIVLLATFIPLLYVHLEVPPAPSSTTPVSGVNLTEAWQDLKEISNGFHPYNSRRNDDVHEWLLHRIEGILKHNNAQVVYDVKQLTKSNSTILLDNDTTSNLTYSSGNLSVYFEGTNIITYIPGSDSVLGNVLVNAHYDSVSTGYGVTDDGMGVITILQLISHFSKHRPKRGVVFLLNNGEEDFLNGAYAFTQNQISQSTRLFLNLEGAGAGGRAVMFRNTDAQVARFYKKSPHPFGAVFSQDGFERGAIRSQTDYVVFNGVLGLRGIDVAFFEPRARYHTIEDATKFDSLASLWQMLSNSIATTQAMTSDTSSSFDGPKREDGSITSGHGSKAVWFDLFGEVLAVFELHTVFAVSVTLLVVTPVFLLLITLILVRVDKWYPFSGKRGSDHDGTGKTVHLGGWRGFFRYPIIFLLSTGLLVALSYLIAKVNPYIIYSSQYAVWLMSLSAYLCVEWFLLYGTYHHRPTVLGRFHALVWMYIGSYILLVAVTIGENNFKIAGAYFVIVYFASIFFALLISYFELFALPKKEDWVQTALGEDENYPTGSQPSSRPVTARSVDLAEDQDDATEQTSLLRGGRRDGYNTYHGRRGSSDLNTLDNMNKYLSDALDCGQSWSSKLPSWTWVLQALFLLPINIILIGQVALLFTSATHQTPADGNPVLPIYLAIAVLTILVLTTIRPFLHKLSYRIWWLLAAIFLGTLLYNLLAFPFSINNRLKVYFVQRFDLDHGNNTVSMLGLDGYVQSIIGELPSTAGQRIHCTAPSISSRNGLAECKWPGLEANVVPGQKSTASNANDWFEFKAKRLPNDTAVLFNISAINTKSCRILFDDPISHLVVTGSAEDDRFKHVGPSGTKEIRLWHREFNKPWEVTVRWAQANKEKSGKGKLGMKGQVVCVWSDANVPGTIPALDEIWRFAPAWSIVTKAADGLVEGSRSFEV